MPTVIKKSIGVGRDFTSMSAFATWLRDQSLKTNDQIVIGEVYDNLSVTSELYPNDHSLNNYCIIRPALGMSVNELQPGDPFHYGDAGVELTVTLIGTSYMQLRPGVILEGFRIKVTGNAADDTTSKFAILMGKKGSKAIERMPEIRFCRFKTSQTGALSKIIGTGEFSYGGHIRDNLFVHDGGNGLSASLNYSTVFERNTIVRLGSAVGYSGTSGYDNTLRDNLYIGCGNVPAQGLPTGTTTRIIANNVTDTAMATPHAGFIVGAIGNVVESPSTDARPKLDSAAIAAGSSAGARTRDMLNRYRGNYPDVGAYQRVAQPLPALATAAITSQVVVEQSITIKGTITGEVTSSVAWLSQGGVKIDSTEKPLTITDNTFEVRFNYLQGGSYDAPTIQLINDGGTGPKATGAQPFNITPAVIPSGDVTKQYVVGRKITIMGTVANSPETGTIVLKADPANPNGAVTQGPLAVTISGNKFKAELQAVPYGNYLPPEITLRNMAGESPLATNAKAIAVSMFVPPVIPGVNIQTIGVGQMHATWKDFVTWIRARNMSENAEIVQAYVMDDLVIGASDSMRLEPMGYTLDNYCTISPAPGCSVNELQRTEPFDYGEVGVEITVVGGGTIAVCPGVRMTGFRITVEDQVGATNATVFNLARVQSARSNTNPGQFYRNRIRSKLSGSTNSVMSCGSTTYDTPSEVYDNYISHESGDAATALLAAGVFQRNTVVRKGTAVGATAVRAIKGNNLNASRAMRDNVFTNTSSTPVTMETGVTVTAESNFVNTTMNPVLAGFTAVAQTAAVEDLLTDARPKLGSALIGAGSLFGQITNDIRGENRGPAPDVGAWQRTPFLPTPTAAITSTVVDGTTVTISGTVLHGPTSGRAWVEPDSANPAGASSLPSKAVTFITADRFTVSWDNVTPGNYTFPVLRFTNSGGEGPPATGGSTFSILAFGGNPIVPDDDGVVGINPSVSITEFTQNGMMFSLKGTFDLMGDPTGKIELYIDPRPDGATVGPLPVTVSGKTWSYEGTTTFYQAQLRAVAVAYGNPQVALVNLFVLKASGSPQMPLQ